APLAWITVVPGATPVTGTFALIAFAAIITVPGTVATPGLVELRLTVRPPAGAALESVSVKFCVVVPEIVRFCGEKPMVAVTWTVPEAGEYPVAVALILAVPKATPVTCGCIAGAVCPTATEIVDGLMVTFAESLLVNVMVTPPAGAGMGKVTGKGTDWPTATD